MPNLKRKKSDGTWQTITPAADFPAKVPIEVTDADLVSLSVTENGTYNPYPHDGYSSVDVDVPGLVPTGNKELTQQSGTDVTNYATASVRSGSVTLNTPTINTSTGVVTASASVSTTGWVGSAPSSKTLSLSTQAAKTVTPSTSEQTAVESGKYTTGAIKVAAMPTATHPAPTASINTSTGVVTASHTQSSGYVTGGTTTGTLALSTQAAKTVTPTTSSQTAVAAQRYTTGAVTVAAVPTETKSITSNGTYTPTSGKFFSSVSVNVEPDTPYGIINVTYPSGSTCTCTKGSTVLTASGTSGSYTFELPEFGTWTVACTNGSQTASESFNAAQPSKTIALAYVASLNDSTWAQISSASASGTASSYWAVGDRKAITLNGKVGDGLTLTNYATYVYILGFNHNGATNTIDFGTFKTDLTGGTDVCLVDTKYNNQVSSGTYFNMNNSNTNTNGWKGSRMRYYLLGSTNSNGADAGTTTATSPVANTLMAALPSDLRAVMKSMTIWTDNVGGGTDTASNVTTSVDYLPLLAEFEIFGARSYANSAERNHQAQYTYYANGASKIKYKHNSTGSTGYWWERSPYCSDSDGFCFVLTGGAARSIASFSFGVAPAFRV